MSDWRSYPRKRILVPGNGRVSKLPPAKQRLLRLERYRARWNANKERISAERAIKRQFDKHFRAAIEAAGSSPGARDRDLHQAIATDEGSRHA